MGPAMEDYTMSLAGGGLVPGLPSLITKVSG